MSRPLGVGGLAGRLVDELPEAPLVRYLPVGDADGGVLEHNEAAAVVEDRLRAWVADRTGLDGEQFEALWRSVLAEWDRRCRERWGRERGPLSRGRARRPCDASIGEWRRSCLMRLGDVRPGKRPHPHGRPPLPILSGCGCERCSDDRPFRPLPQFENVDDGPEAA